MNMHAMRDIAKAGYQADDLVLVPFITSPYILFFFALRCWIYPAFTMGRRSVGSNNQLRKRMLLSLFNVVISLPFLLCLSFSAGSSMGQLLSLNRPFLSPRWMTVWPRLINHAGDMAVHFSFSLLKDPGEVVYSFSSFSLSTDNS
jgi:hypothetical protein